MYVCKPYTHQKQIFYLKLSDLQNSYEDNKALTANRNFLMIFCITALSQILFLFSMEALFPFQDAAPPCNPLKSNHFFSHGTLCLESVDLK